MKNQGKKIDIVEEPMAIYNTYAENTFYSLIEKIKEGISYNSFLKLVKNSPFNISEWAAFMHLSERTMQRYKTNNKKFDAIYSEKIIEVSLLNQYALEVLDTKENYEIWLNTKNISLGGIKPKELLDTTFGIQILKDELLRIEHGVLA
jgi:putative toxin-antitoxin system antitoxin component (TIGR02293 family)